MSDFTFRDPLTGIIRFNDANVIHIGYEPSSEDITITAQNDETGTSKTINVNMSGGGGGAVLGQKTITVNGTYDAEDDGLDGYDQVTVNVPVPTLGTKSITENGTYSAASDNLGGYSSVTVNVEASGDITPDDIATKSKPAGAITITSAVSSIWSRAFENYKNITAVNIAGDPYIGTYAFSGCSEIATLNARELTAFKAGLYDSTQNVFNGCSKLQGVVFPKLTGGVPSYMFNNCTLLTYADFNNISGITGASVFEKTGINLLIIRKTNDIATLSNVNNFTNTPLAANGAGGDIYVPSSLISQYEQATNWSALNATFKAIEGSYYETHYADGSEVTP